MTWRIFSLAVSAACLLILVRSGGWLCAVGTPLSLAAACLISNGHTRLSGLSMWCPLWSNDNPRTTSSFPRICRTTFPFFLSPQFFSSATINTTSPIFGTFAVLRVTRWVSIRLWTCSCLHLFQAWFLASLSRLLSALVSSSSSSPSIGWAFCPQIKMFGVNTCSSPPSLSR